MTTLFKRIKQVRTVKNLTIRAIEEGTGMPVGTLKKWKESMPSGDKILRVANFLDVSVDFLLGNTNDPSSHKMANLFRQAYPEFAELYAKFDVGLQAIIQKYHLSVDPALENLDLESDSTGEDDKDSL